MRPSNDTIYNYSPANDTKTPIITRTPTIHLMSPEIFLFPTVITDRYYFMRTMKKEIDFTTFRGFSGKDLVYDRVEKALFECIVYNDDFSKKQELSLGEKNGNTVSQEIVTSIALNASDLVEAYEEGQLKGPLNEIAMGLDEDSNPIIMLIKHKK